MLFKTKQKHSPIKTMSEFVGSTNDKVIHSTANPCSDVTNMDPNHRWYIRKMPKSREYTKCPKCFPKD